MAPEVAWRGENLIRDMNMLLTAFIALIASSLAGASPLQARTDLSTPTLLNFTIAADGRTFVTNIINGPLSSHHQAQVLYDWRRADNAGCESAFQEGFDTMAVVVHYKDATGHVGSLDQAFFRGTFQIQPPVYLPNPLPAGDLQFWFTCSSEVTAVVYDSNYSKNWDFKVAK
ncbi:hypothetical protein HK101_007256 [Irineochytrium annulatum]|nr:hypothetical protein HK101_007256 [Irineochytrium annulatum]